MSDWTSGEVTKIAAADELDIASLRGDGMVGKPVTIWVVRHGDDLYVRSIHGRSAGWFRGTQVRHEGHIEAGGVDKDVRFVDAAADIADELDTAYRAKYRRYAANIVSTVLSAEARSATLQLVPR
jgi:hypothetical protein